MPTREPGRTPRRSRSTGAAKAPIKAVRKASPKTTKSVRSPISGRVRAVPATATPAAPSSAPSSRVSGRKRSVSMPDSLLAEVDQRAGRGQFSAYITRAVERQVALDRLADYVAEVEAELGRSISDELMAEAETAWHAG